MAAWSGGLRQDLLLRQLSRTRSLLGRAHANMVSRSQRMANSAAARCSSFVRRPALPRESLAGKRSSTEGPSQEVLWRQFFLDQSLWWDNRQQKQSCRSPHFRHKKSHEVLWLNSFHKPAWVDAQLAALDLQMGPRTPGSNLSFSDDPDPRRPARYERSLTSETVSKLCHQGQLSEAVEALGVLVQTDSRIPKSIFYAVLKKCVAKKDLFLGRCVHTLTAKMGYESDTFLCNHILRMYASHGRLQEAMDVFTMVPKPDVFTWSSIISAHVRHRQAKQAIQLYHQMRRSSVKPDGHVFVAALQACASGADLKTGQLVHADVLDSGVAPDLFVCSCLLDMYAKCGSLKAAETVFDRLLDKDVVTWNTMIAGYAQQGMGQEALRLYYRMQQESVCIPDSVTFVCLLQACASVGITAIEKGKQLHAQIEERGLRDELVVGCSLVNMYAKCGSLGDAQTVFDRLSQKDVVTWNAMIAGYAQQGMGQEALRVYSDMQQEGVSAPDSVTFVCLLQACACVGITAMEKGRQVHGQIEERGLQADLVVGCSLVNMYAKCGSLGDAQTVFNRLHHKDVVTWNAMIAGYVQQGMGQEALRIFYRMQQEGISAPNAVTFVCLLQACASLGIPAMAKGKHFHAQIEEQGLEADAVVGCSLVNMYAKCGSLEDAQSVFERLLVKDVMTWNAMMGGYVQQGMGQEALRLYNRMRQEGISAPDSVTFVCLLQACASVGITAIKEGKQLHAHIQKQGLESVVTVGNSLINMYAKCGGIEDAQSMFDWLHQKDVVTWNAMIAGYTQQGMSEGALCLYSDMQQEGICSPNSVTFVCLLQACISVKALHIGRELHARIGEIGLQADVFVANSLINMYAKCGSLMDAQSMFETLHLKDVVTWNTMIAAYADQGMSQEALRLYNRMQQECTIAPDSVTFVCVLQACASVGMAAIEIGKQLHAQVEERGLEADVVIGCSLVSMYAKCGSLEDAQSVFEGLRQKDVVTWSAMIAGYAAQGMREEAFRIYSDMEQEGIIAPDSVTLACLLQACAKSGNLEDAQSIFDGLRRKDVVTWNVMIAGYAQQGMGQEALLLYNSMRQEGTIAPDSVTFVCVLQACASVGMVAFETGKQLHAQIKEQGLQAVVAVGNSLVNMYAKCGSLEDARSMFDGLCQKDVVTWNSMTAGYAQQGMDQEALRLYSDMQQEGITSPDSVTFVCLLQACAGVAALHSGRQLHAEIEERGLQSDVSVANSLISMYSKSGSMVDAQQVFDALPERDIVAWNALIAGYSRQGDSEVVFDLVHRMKEGCIQPNGITFLSVLTVCSHAGLVHKGRNYFEDMSREYGITPTVEHYTCLVDLLGRAGQLDEALAVVRTMPVQPHEAIWHTLLGACRNWSNVEVGRHAFDEAVKLDHTDAAAYVMMSDIYIGAQMWEAAQEMQAKRKRMGAWKEPGQSWWTDMGGVVHTFLAGNASPK